MHNYVLKRVISSAHKCILEEITLFSTKLHDFILKKLNSSAHKCILEENCSYEEKINALEYDPKFIYFIKDKTPELCMLAVQKDGHNLIYLPEEHKTYEICLTAIQNGKYKFDYDPVIVYVPEKYITPELCIEAIKKDSNSIDFIPLEHITPDVCVEAVKHDSRVLGYVSEKYKTPELCTEAVKKDGHALRYVPEKYKTPELCILATQNCLYALDYVPKEYITQDLYTKSVQNYIDGPYLSTNENYDYSDYFHFFTNFVNDANWIIKKVPEEYRTPELLSSVYKIIPNLFFNTNIPESIKKEDIVDPVTFENVEEKKMYAFFKENGNFYIVSSFDIIMEMIINKFRGSNGERVFVPVKNSLIDISELHWVIF
jgi:hypothetical protein